MVSQSRRWKIVLSIGMTAYCIGVLVGFFAERFGVDALNVLFLTGIALGGIVSAVAYVALALTLSAGSAITGGSISVFLAFSLAQAAEHFGWSTNIHGSVGIGAMLFVAIVGLGGALLLVFGFARMADSAE